MRTLTHLIAALFIASLTAKNCVLPSLANANAPGVPASEQQAGTEKENCSGSCLKARMSRTDKEPALAILTSGSDLKATVQAVWNPCFNVLKHTDKVSKRDKEPTVDLAVLCRYLT